MPRAQVLQLENNKLQDLVASMRVLSSLPFLKSLNLRGNPLTQELNYRATVIHSNKELTLLDAAKVTMIERKDAAELFNTKKIKKKYAFMERVLPWDKPEVPPRGTRSVLEEDLLHAVQATGRRRQAEARAVEAAAMRDAARPRFDVTFRKGGTVTPYHEITSYELFGQGRVPELRVQVGAIRLTPAAEMAVEVASGGGSSSVMVTVNAMRILPQPLCSRTMDVATVVAASSRAEPANMRFDTLLFEDARAAAYERITQVLKTGPPEALALSIELCEEKGRVLGRGRYSLAGLLAQRNERCASEEVVVRAVAGVGLTKGAELGQLRVSVTPDWNVTNAKTNHLAQRRQEGRRLPPPPPQGKLSSGELLQFTRSLGMRATSADIAEAERFIIGGGGDATEGDAAEQPPEASAGRVSIISAQELHDALPALQKRHYAAADKALSRGQPSAAHSHSQAALRLSAAGGADEVPLSVPAPASKSSRVWRKDSFTLAVHERAPTEPLEPPAPSEHGIVLDEVGYTAFLEKKATLAPVRGNRMTMTI